MASSVSRVFAIPDLCLEIARNINDAQTMRSFHDSCKLHRSTVRNNVSGRTTAMLQSSTPQEFVRYERTPHGWVPFITNNRSQVDADGRTRTNAMIIELHPMVSPASNYRVAAHPCITSRRLAALGLFQDMLVHQPPPTRIAVDIELRGPDMNTGRDYELWVFRAAGIRLCDLAAQVNTSVGVQLADLVVQDFTVSWEVEHAVAKSSSHVSCARANSAGVLAGHTHFNAS